MKYEVIDNKVINEDGEVGIIISPGHGAGWSTWAYSDEAKIESVYDADCVMALLEGDKAKVKNIAVQKWGDFLWHTRDIIVKWIPRNKPFIVEEYDGHESITYRDETNWITL